LGFVNSVQNASNDAKSGGGITGADFNKLQIYTVEESKQNDPNAPKNQQLERGKLYVLVIDFSQVSGVVLRRLTVSELGENIDLTKGNYLTTKKVVIPIEVPTGPVKVVVNLYGDGNGALATSSLTVTPSFVVGTTGTVIGSGPFKAQAYNTDSSRYKLSWDFGNGSAYGGASIVYVSGNNILDPNGRPYDYTYNTGLQGSVDVIPGTSSVYTFELYKGLYDRRDNIPPVAVKKITLPTGAVQGAFVAKGVQARGPSAVRIR
jgi:hypothetical protein